MHYPDIDALPDHLKEIIRGKLGANVYKMLMHTPNVAPGFTAMADAVMWSKTWSAQLRELAIVRVGQLYASPYEVHQHKQIGRRAGLSEAQLAACALDADQSALNDGERSILRWTDAIVSKHRLAQADIDAAVALLGVNGFADFVLTVGFYQAVCNFLNVFDVQVEDHDIFAAQRG